MERITSDHPNSGSADLVQENIEQLKQLFPEVIKEGKVDFEALHDLLGNYGDTAAERFCLNWAGKANARREAQKRSTGTLRPCPEESVDWNNTENLYIEGDNLEVLKLLQKGYHGKVKMIYIDPPYNTGKDFVYKDNYVDNMANYLELTGQDKKLSTNNDTDGRMHSNWLNMMYPRLKLARNLLSENGVIFISIDDNEQCNLKQICDEVFGVENFVANFIWEKRTNRENRKVVSSRHDYVICYTKSISTERSLKQLPMNEKALANYKNPDNDPRGPWKSDPATAQAGHGTKSQFYTLIAPNGKKHNLESGRCWLYTEQAMERAIVNGEIWFGKDGNAVPRVKTYLYSKERGLTPETVLFASEVGTNESAKNALKKLFDGHAVFETPKPVALISTLLKMGTDKDSIVLDFFSGSCSTAEAVIDINSNDGGNRRFICVQLPERVPEDSVASKVALSSITEIGKERIRRVSSNFKLENPEINVDLGFKVLKLDSSNLNEWDSTPDNAREAIQAALFNVKQDRTEDDLLYEILLKYGIDLSVKVNRHEVAGKTVYEMGAGSLIICLANDLTVEVAEGIGKLWKEVRPDSDVIDCRVVFKEDGFNSKDDLKANTMLILKRHGIQNIATI